MAKDSFLRKNYGISLGEYNDICQIQDGRCAICGEIPSTDLVVDHDHSTGMYRQLLCATCNLGLGQFRDDPALLRAAAEYVEYHSQHNATLQASTQLAQEVASQESLEAPLSQQEEEQPQSEGPPTLWELVQQLEDEDYRRKDGQEPG